MTSPDWCGHDFVHRLVCGLLDPVYNRLSYDPQCHAIVFTAGTPTRYWQAIGRYVVRLKASGGWIGVMDWSLSVVTTIVGFAHPVTKWNLLTSFFFTAVLTDVLNCGYLVSIRWLCMQVYDRQYM